MKDQKSLTLHWHSPEWNTNCQWVLNFCMFKWIQWFLTANKSFLHTHICIQKLQCLSLSDPPLDTSSEWYLTLAYHGTVLSVGNSLHIDLYTSFWYFSPDFLDFPHPAHSLWFLRPTRSKFSKSQQCAQGLSREWCSWTDCGIQYDRRHSSQFMSCVDCFIDNTYDITDLHVVCEFCV